MRLYNITFERISQNSAMEGDAEERGLLHVDLNTLREAVQYWYSAAEGSTVEADEWPLRAPRWFTAYGDMRPYSGDYVNVSLHLPDNITPSSRLRIARLVGCCGS